MAFANVPRYTGLEEHPVHMQLPLHVKTVDDVKEVTGEIDCA